MNSLGRRPYRHILGQAFGLSLFLAGLVPQGLVAQDLRVTTSVELRDALETIQGGTILLADGSYEALEIEGAFEHTVTLRAERLHGAVLASIHLSAVANLRLEDLVTQGTLSIRDDSSDIAVTGMRIHGTLYCRDIDRLTITDVEVSGGTFGIVLNSIRHFTVSHNLIQRASEDLMRVTGDSYDGVIEYNILFDAVAQRPTHPDLIQFFGSRAGDTPRDITVRRNLLVDPDAPGDVTAQGIFVSDPRGGEGYHNILIEENLINTRSVNTIYINGGLSNVVVRNNTLIPGNGDGGAMIRLAEKSEIGNPGTVVVGNVIKLLVDETEESQIGENYIYGRDAPLARMFFGPGTQWQHYLPVPGSVYDRSGQGAVRFLQELEAASQPGATGGVRLGPIWAQ
jgi:hypothetical protein